MRNFAQEANMFPLIVPVDLAGGANAAVTRVDMKLYQHVEIVVIKNAGAAVEPVVITVSQHNAATVGTTKALPIPHGVYVKFATALKDATEFVVESRDASPNTEKYTSTTSIQKQAFIRIPIDAEDLDVDGGYHWLSAAIADVGNGAQIGTAFIEAFNPRYTPPPNAATAQ